MSFQELDEEVIEVEEFEGNCDLCFKKSDSKLVKAINKNRDLIDWWANAEKEHSAATHGKRAEKINPSFFFRSNRSVQEMVALADEALKQPALFLDETEYDCHCKAT